MEEKPERRYCQGCDAYYPDKNHKHGNRVCVLDALGACRWVNQSPPVEGELTFYDGYICAVANIIRTHDEPVIAKDVLQCIGKVAPATTEPDDYALLKEHGLV